MRFPLYYFHFILLIALALFSRSASAQLSGAKYIPGDYATLSAAITAVNASGVGLGGVIFNIAAGHTETIAVPLSLTATGTLANPIQFRKDPGTSGANPVITAYTGGTATNVSALQDGIWRMVGSDYLTIDGINLAENAANTSNPATMEYGYALYKANTSNGCQNVTIRNCTITLNRVNNTLGTAPMAEGSVGILCTNSAYNAAITALVPASVNGANSNNKFYGNTIQNCNTGIAISGYAAASPFTLADVGNDVGGTSAATGNTILNYGGSPGAANPATGIRTTYQYGLNVSYNTINSNNGSGVNHPNILRGILVNTASSASATVSYNTVTVHGGGTTQSVVGIQNASGSTPASNTVNISNNSITGCTYTTATTAGFYGIYNTANPAAMIISNNTVSNNASSAGTTGFFYGVLNSGTSPSVSINSNTISGNTTANLTSGLFVGLYNSGSAGAVSISSNTFFGNSTTATTGVFYGIYNTGIFTVSLAANSNILGTAVSPAINFVNANAGSQALIYASKGGAAAALSISSNTIRNIGHSVTGTGAYTIIQNSGATLSQNISNNIFSNLSVNTAGNVTCISNSVSVSGSGTQTISGNSISGSFTKAAGGILTFFSSSGTSSSGAVINHTGNNFSNVTVTGATTITGWSNTDAGSGTRIISGNTFSNWTSGTGGITVVSTAITSVNNATTGNLINNITGGANINGISTGAGNDKIYGNIINAITSTGTGVVNGITITSGTNKNVYANKIYDLQSSGAGGTVNGISTTGTTSSVVAANIYNNTIGDLRTPLTSSTDAIRGINLSSTRANSALNVSNNTIYLNASSSGANFGTSGIYHAGSTTATTAALTMRNNIISNLSSANGTGKVVAYRRGLTSLNNYTTTSNNNLLYAGTPGAARLLFYDGTNSDQTMASYKTRAGSRDVSSVTEDITTVFLSTSGASSNFLHLDPSTPTQAESGGANVTGLTLDFDMQTRQGNAGYPGTGTAPDMGADEFEGIKALPLSGIYTVGTGGNYSSLTNLGGLFAAINNLGLAGDVEVNVISDLSETGSNILNQWTEQGVGNYSLTIQPDAATLRTISGNVTGALIRLEGADRVSIDGNYAGSGKYLSFKNTNTAGTTGTAFTFINGAAGNSILNCKIEAFANATNGVILFSTSTVSGGNSSNTIDRCEINATSAGNTGNVAIYSSGTATAGFQNSSNTISNNTVFNYRDRGIDVTATGSTGWTISGNSLYNGDVTGSVNYAAATALHGIRVLGGTGYTITGNYIGGSAIQAGGTQASYSSSLGLLTMEGILLTTTGSAPASVVKGNTIANIAVSAIPSSTAAGGSNIFFGIETTGSGVNIGGSLPGEGNIIGSNTANGNISITTTTALTTHRSNVRGIYCQSSGGQVIGNRIGGIDIRNIGAAPAATTFYGILVNIAIAPAQVNSNVIGSDGVSGAANSIRVISTSTATATALTGVAIGSLVTSAVQLDGNKIQNLSHLSTATTVTAGGITGISSAAAGTATVSITNNNINSNYFASYTTGVFYGIINSGAATTLNINNNTIAGNSNAAASGAHIAIINSGAVTGTININGNNIGTSGTNAFTFTAANSGTSTFISNTAGTSTASLSISNNNFQKIVYSAASTGINTYISNSAATLSQAINGNSFINLDVNTSGNVTFISNSVAISATGTQNINNNAISGTFTKRAGGIVTLFTSTATSIAGGVVNNNSNNFSNITVTGATTIAGWVNTDAGAATKTIQNNTFSNWSGGTSGITAMSVSLTSSNNAVTGNTISNISGGGAITGIATGVGNDRISSNIISGLSTTGASAVSGILLTAGTAKTINKNKIYDLQANSATGSVNGILISGSTILSANLYNNLIGDLRNPSASSTTDLIRGIAITATTANSSFGVYYNSIYINASSTGTNFSSTGIYHTANATATTANLTLKNNVITNLSTPKGTGYTAAYRRSSTALGNYNTASNNNLYYAGSPGASRLIFSNGTNLDQTLAAFQARVANRDSVSVTEDLTPKLLSTSGTSLVFLHLDNTIPSLIVNGGVPVAGITEDFDGQIRYGNPGYTGFGYAPDIGADETFGIELVPPAISYTPLADTTSTTNRIMDNVVITDGSDVSTAPGTKPRIYYKRLVDANTFADNTSNTNGWKFTEATNASSPFSFTIDYSQLYGGATATAGIIQYFIVAQDQATTANIAINSGTFTSTPSSVALTSAAFPIGGVINSYKIPFAGTFYIGSGEVYTSFTKSDGLFAAINAAGLKGNTTALVSSDIAEDGANGLSQWTESGTGNYTLNIKPDGSTLRIISGNVVNGLIRLDGADRVKIDGSQNDSLVYLTFRNTNTTGTSGTALTLAQGATTDSFRYCSFEAYANATNGVIFFGPSAVSDGNSYNQLAWCKVNATVTGNTGATGIYSGGSAGSINTGNSIVYNSIYNYQDRGLDLNAAGSSAWTISGNSFYNGDVSGTVNYPDGSALHGIRIAGGSGYMVSGNYIGGNASGATGTNAIYTSSLGDLSYHGILLNTSTALPVSDIKGNTVAKISLLPAPNTADAASFTGIETNGPGISVGGISPGEGNLIGANTGNGSITFTTTTASSASTSLLTGIHISGSGGVVAGNQVSGFDINNTGSSPAPCIFRGIYIDDPSPSTTIYGNIVGSFGIGASASSIRVRLASTAPTTSLRGIELANTVTASLTLDSNTVQNFSVNSTTSSGNFTGILNNAGSGTITSISRNLVRAITAAANSNVSSTVYTGIGANTKSLITHNTIDAFNLSATGNASQIRGIYTSGSHDYSVTGNTVSNLNTASTKTGNIETGDPSGFTVAGILNAATATGQIVDSNTLYNFNATSAAVTNTAVTGIAISGGSQGVISQNRLTGFTSSATGSSSLPGISGIYSYDGSCEVYNNAIRIENSGHPNGVKIYGINHASAGNGDFLYNTIYITGTATGTAARSAALTRAGNGSMLAKNNVLYNTRSGTGSHFAISNLGSPASTGWPASASDHNDIYSVTGATTGEWGSANARTFAQWKTSSGGDAASVNRPVSFISSSYDLEPDPVSNCALDNAGIPITSPVAISTDISETLRNATTPDIGAYEFEYTPFEIDPSSNTPVCAGGNVELAIDAGDAINPTYIWTNPSHTQVSTDENPTVAALAGYYTVVVTDINGCFVSDSTLVALNTRPTATITGATTICEETPVNITLHVTGSGTITGTLNSGDPFSGTAPTIIVSVVPSITTDYYIEEMSDANCASLPQDIDDTVTIGVINDAYWTGNISTAWTLAGNWLCGSPPDSSTNAIIPAGLTNYPIISTGIAAVSNITLGNATSLTINGATLRIAGNIANSGSVTASNGKIIMEGADPQTIPAGLFTSNTLKDLTVVNTSGVTLAGNLNLTGVLKLSSGNLSSAGYLTLASNSTRTALIDGSGTGQVTGNVTMQRYLPSGFGYKYFSSPFQVVTVGQFANDLDLNASFPTFYRYDENQSATGFLSYVTPSGSLNVLEGYTANFGSATTTKTVDITGVVNNGPLSSPTLYNHNRTYTKGFNLAGNPYPSPVDWNAAFGWTKTNIDNAIYYFNAGTTSQYTGSYSSYINGVSSDGIAGNIIPSMQGFFIHVSNGTYPVSGSLVINNNARTLAASPVFHKTTQPDPLIRISLTHESDTTADNMVVYFNPEATHGFDPEMDALKLMNTDSGIPNLFALSADSRELSIDALPNTGIEERIIPLGLRTEKDGWLTFRARELENLPTGINTFLYDAVAANNHNFTLQPSYKIALSQGAYGDRFFLVFTTRSQLNFDPASAFNAYSNAGTLYVMLDMFTGQSGDLVIRNMLGQTVLRQSLSGYGYHEIKYPFTNGVYIVSFAGSKQVFSKKIFLGQ
jgi:hypothetical protein